MYSIISILVFCFLLGAPEIEKDLPVLPDDYASTYEVDSIIIEECSQENAEPLYSDSKPELQEEKEPGRPLKSFHAAARNMQ